MTERFSRKPSTGRHRGKVSRPARAAAAPPAKIEVHGEEHSSVRQRVRATPGVKGLGLRWKILIAMTSVVLLTAILIFIFVSSKTVSLLNEQIDAKGERLINLLASMDEEYWHAAIHATPEITKREMQDFIDQLGAQKDWELIVKQKGLSEMQEWLRNPGLAGREAELEFFLNVAVGNRSWKGTLEGSADLKKQYERFLGPFARLPQPEPLRELEKELGKDLLDAGVVDVTEGGASGPAIGVAGRSMASLPAAAPGEKLQKLQRRYTNEKFKIDTLSRTFILNPDESSKRKFRYYVSLSLAAIDQAQGQMSSAIFLPILLTGVIAIGIAIWVATLVTKPLNVLMRDIQAVSRGDLGHKTVATSKDEIGQLADTFNKMTQALKAAHEQELEQKALEHELNIASQIQSNLVPKAKPKIPGWDVGAFYRPSKEVGGDYYDFIRVDEENVAFVVADVSGKGVPGSLVMSMARAFIRMEAERSRNASPLDTLIRVNRMLATDIKKGMFVTALYCILNVKSGELRVSSAGHNPLLLWRASENKIQLVNPSGIALGFDKGPVFERSIKEESVTLSKGDRIVAYTDGTVEAMNDKNEEFGDAKFRELCRRLGSKTSDEFVANVVHVLDQHKGEAPQHDDMTIVTVRAT